MLWLSRALKAGWTRESWQAFVLDYARRPATGDWGENKEWEYFLHGGSCRSTHKVTQERIEWDLGSLRTFDQFWFVNYLQSLLDQNTDDALVVIQARFESEKKLKPGQKPSYRPLDAAIFPILEQLHQMGLLSQQRQYYTLTSLDQLPDSHNDVNSSEN